MGNKFFKSLRRSSKAIALLLGGDDESGIDLGDASVSRPTYRQVVESIPEVQPNAGAPTQEAGGSHQRQSSNVPRSRTGGRSYVEFATQERSFLSGKDDEALDLLCSLVKNYDFGALYNSRFSELCDITEVVFLGRLWICKALQSEGKDSEIFDLYGEKMRTFFQLLHDMTRVFALCGPGYRGEKRMSGKKVEKYLQEFSVKLEGYTSDLTKAVEKLNPEFVRIADALLLAAFPGGTTSSKLLERVIEIVQELHSGTIRQTSYRNTVLDGDVVAEPEGRQSTLPIDVSASRARQGGSIQFTDRQLVEEPVCRQSTIQHSTTTSSPSRANPQPNSWDARSASGSFSSQHPTWNGHSTAPARHTMDDEVHRSSAARAAKSSKTAPPREHPDEEEPSRQRRTTKADMPSTRRSSRLGRHTEDQYEGHSERRRERGGDRPRREPSGTTSTRGSGRIRPKENSIKEESDRIDQESSSEDDKERRRRRKKALTHDSDRRRQTSGPGRDSYGFGSPPTPSSYYFPNQGLEFLLGVVNAQHGRNQPPSSHGYHHERRRP